MALVSLATMSPLTPKTRNNNNGNASNAADSRRDVIHLRRRCVFFLGLIGLILLVTLRRFPTPSLEHVLANSNNHHCFFIVSSLWGSKSDSRTLKSMNWYQHATVESIVASKNYLSDQLLQGGSGRHHHVVVRLPHVEPILIAQDKFLSMELSGGDSTTMQHEFTRLNKQDSKSIAKHLEEVVDNKKCNIVSFMRLDADDIVLPTSFSTILHQFERNCGSSFTGNEGKQPCVMVSGSKRMQTFSIHPTNTNNAAAADAQNKELPATAITNKDTVYCKLADFAPRKTFFSQGLTVTLPVSLWKEHFQKRIVVLSKMHDELFSSLQKEGRTGGTGNNNNNKKQFFKVIPNTVQNQAIWMFTPLSAHYNYENPPQGQCPWKKLERQLPTTSTTTTQATIVQFLQNLSQHVPSLTRDEWQENFFVRRNNMTALPENS